MNQSFWLCICSYFPPFPISVLLVLTSSVSAGNTKDAFGCTQSQLSLMMSISGNMEMRHHIGWGCLQIGSMWALAAKKKNLHPCRQQLRLFGHMCRVLGLCQVGY